MKIKHKIIASIVSLVFMIGFATFHQVDTHHASTQEVLSQLNLHNPTNLTQNAYFDWSFLVVFLIFLVFNICLWTRKGKVKHSNNVVVHKDEFEFFKEKEMNHEEEH